jgi:hypothetical protein
MCFENGAPSSMRRGLGLSVAFSEQSSNFLLFIATLSVALI